MAIDIEWLSKNSDTHNMICSPLLLKSKGSNVVACSKYASKLIGKKVRKADGGLILGLSQHYSTAKINMFYIILYKYNNCRK